MPATELGGNFLTKAAAAVLYGSGSVDGGTASSTYTPYIDKIDGGGA